MVFWVQQLTGPGLAWNMKRMKLGEVSLGGSGAVTARRMALGGGIHECYQRMESINDVKCMGCMVQVNAELGVKGRATRHICPTQQVDKESQSRFYSTSFSCFLPTTPHSDIHRTSTQATKPHERTHYSTERPATCLRTRERFVEPAVQSLASC